MGEDIIALSIPLFFILIFIEWVVSYFQKTKNYRFNDALTDLNSGTGEQVFGILQKIIFIAFYESIFRKGALTHLPLNSLWTWVSCLLWVDFIYYWFHRSTHRINFLWATHVVHHQSEDYNLAVALRQPWFQGFFHLFFHLPLAILGYPVVTVVAMVALDTVLQFWVHTRTVKRLPGVLEWILNTPSHHRVHHARNPKYLDKNYAGALIIWDRLFGTFQKEEDEPVYGIVKPLQSWNVAWANVHYWVDLAKISQAQKTWKDKILVWFLSPEETGSPAPFIDAQSVQKYDCKQSLGWNIYLAVQFILAALILLALLKNFEQNSIFKNVAASTLVLWTVVTSGGLLEGKRWAKLAEGPRLLAVVVFMAS